MASEESGGSLGAGVPTGVLATDAIQTLLDAAGKRARELGVKVHVSVMDSSADLVGWLSFQGAPRIAATTARHKSFTAVNTGMSTADWKTYVDGIPEEERRIIDGIEGYIAAAGGIPIIEHGILLGGIGISGANQEIDEDCATAAVEALQISR